MIHEDPGNVSFSAIGGLSDQIREIRETIELPLQSPELFIRVGIKPSKVPHEHYRSFTLQVAILFSGTPLVSNILLKVCANKSQVNMNAQY
jgi:SpoVK/Ycf46/Vps4 family AAA+-type ATPase